MNLTSLKFTILKSSNLLNMSKPHLLLCVFTASLYCFITFCLVLSKTNLTTDESAILAFKSSLTLHPNHNLFLVNNWSTSFPVCNWFGVRCDERHRRVRILNLSNMGLKGIIPPQLGNLSFLVELDLSSNEFYGQLPKELVHLRGLKLLNLSSNGFNGTIPASLSNLSKLEILDWGSNFITGNIPPEVGLLHRLKTLNVEGNKLSGTIPPTISNLSSLEFIRFSHNSLSGDIPKEIGYLPQLKFLNLNKNKFSGYMPLTIFNHSVLQQIDLGENILYGNLPSNICGGLPKIQTIRLVINQLSGQFPPVWHECKQLIYINLSNNRFKKGIMPGDVGNMTMVQSMYFADDNLEGEIPSSIFNISTLRALNFQVNNLHGSIPEDMCHWLPFLEEFSLDINQFGGTISRSISNCTLLRRLLLTQNAFTGPIPREIGNLNKLQMLGLGFNHLSGSIPSNILNLTGLTYLFLANNSLSGSLPSDMGSGLPNLQQLHLYENNLVGKIPSSICNASKLLDVDLSVNQFSGTVPNALGNLRGLRSLRIYTNNLSIETSTSEINFLTSLTNCRYLKFLQISGNPFVGRKLPESIGNFSDSLEHLIAYSCGIVGNVPLEIGNLSGLIDLNLGQNYLNGPVPGTIMGLHHLQSLNLAINRIQGPVINQVCELGSLAAMYLYENELYGVLPTCLGNLTSLRILEFSANRLVSEIPSSLLNLRDILMINLSSNAFIGSLPLEVGNLEALVILDLSRNQISGNIPTTIGGLKTLENLYLAHNKLEGSIPESIQNLISLAFLDLAQNNLSGVIPKSLESLKDLKYINLSYNKLEGEIPNGGPFKNFNAQSFMFNKALCGISRFQVPPCSPKIGKRSKAKLLWIKIGLPIIILGILVVSCTILILRCRRKNAAHSLEENLTNLLRIERISYHELFQATNGFDDSNLIGKGGFSSVYKGVLSSGKLVAIKVINLALEVTERRFDIECEAMCQLRHRNLIKIITSCSNLDFKSLVMEFMPNGSLEKWLHSHNHYLNFLQRLNIMIDVAFALEYLHHGSSIPVVHCDVKPSNVLLDEDMVAYLGDFGIAKLLDEGQSRTHTITMATFGYMAPEYGSEGLVSTKGDVYSYGIMLMEMFTKKKPTDDMFTATGLNLRSSVSNSMANKIMQIVDFSLMQHEGHNADAIIANASSILTLALNCCEDLPEARINMENVTTSLNKIKINFTQMQTIVA